MNDLMPVVVMNYLPYGIGLAVLLVALFFVRVWIRSSVNKKVRSIRDTPAMSMMDIDAMHKRGLVSEAEYKAIRHALAGREVERERRRKQAERERAILSQIENDPDAARELLELEPAAAASAATTNGRMAHLAPQPEYDVPDGHQTRPQPPPGAHGAPRSQNPQQSQPETHAKPAPAARPVVDDLEAEQARVFALSSADLVLPELLRQAQPAQPAPPRPASRPAAQRPAVQQPAARPAPAPHPAQTPTPQAKPAPRPAAPALAQQPAARPVQPATARPVPAAANKNHGKPASDLDLLLQKGAITPEEYQRLKAFVQ